MTITCFSFFGSGSNWHWVVYVFVWMDGSVVHNIFFAAVVWIWITHIMIRYGRTGYPPGPAAIDLRRKAARGRPDPFRLQYSKGVHSAPCEYLSPKMTGEYCGIQANTWLNYVVALCFETGGHNLHDGSNDRENLAPRWFESPVSLTSL